MNEFIGVWEIKAWEAQRGNEIFYPYGKSPKGYLTYLSDTKMMTVVMRDRSEIPDIFNTYNPLDVTDEECVTSFKAYMSYWGSYKIDYDASMITHKLEGCWYPKWVGTIQERHFEFKNGLLILSFEIDDIHTDLTWQKIPSALDKKS